METDHTAVDINVFILEVNLEYVWHLVAVR